MPSGYQPHLLTLEKNGKDPLRGMSWKKPENSQSIERAMKLLQMGFNIGIAGTPNDRLVIVDVDNLEVTPVHTLKPTLMSRSSKRLGVHAFYSQVEGTRKIGNIPTPQHYGEVRSIMQYVVAPGSYVPRLPEEIERLPDELKASAGKYTIEFAQPPNTITFAELPPVFIKQYEASVQSEHPKRQYDANRKRDSSKFYDLTIQDVTPTNWNGRQPHPLHDSETGKNWMIKGNLGVCWRDWVTLNAQQYLCVESGFMTCGEAGTPMKEGEGVHGSSRYSGNDEALLHAVRQAWKRGLCGREDMVPQRVLRYLARTGDRV